jgi:hypothetical protein
MTMMRGSSQGGSVFTVLKNPINAYLIERAIRIDFADLFSYRRRAVKRLLRLLMDLAATIGENERVNKEAVTVEVWIACITMVSQGYWMSSRPESTKKQVLDEFYERALSITINEALVPTHGFQAVNTHEQDQILQGVHIEVQRDLERRGREYVAVIRECVEEGNTPPTKLAKLIMHNFFGTGFAMSAGDVQRMDIAVTIAIPMMQTYARALKS